MGKKAYIYNLDANNNMRFVCSGGTKESAEKKLYNILGKRIKINWSDVVRTDPASGGSMWHGVISDAN